MKFITFNESDIRAMTNDLNIGLRRLSFEENFTGVRRVFTDLKAGELSVSHGLKTVPSYRMILSQEGGTYITDVRSKWTDKDLVLNIASDTARLELFIGV